ncbi:hypothetical protein [Actinorugispora endophytica]|uniref:DUF8083 domain-containing protein n=1 Tax=Actinorugispora endophytica TaxID=1605990 RepID=A0A4R6V755_9ACTN|nr:hypothetical protein [Actinorugispora endophytica]TDQ54936.1 hypothetical protein EV190_101255 [Actinorugispora endophytica]
MFPYTAYLRLYQPLVAFSSREREHWRAYANSPHRPRRVDAMAVEHAESLARLTADPPVVVPPGESRDAYVRRVGDELFVCPWQSRLRSWIAFTAFRASTSEQVSRAFVPEPVARETERDFERWRRRTGPAQPQILTSTWEVPPAWFVPFDTSERCLVLGPSRNATRGETDSRFSAHLGGAGLPGEAALPPPEHAQPRALLYVAGMSDVRARLERAVRLLSGVSAAHSSILYNVERLEDWAGSLAHPRALLELDYGGLVHLLDDDALRADHSVAETSAVLTGLEADRPEVVKAMRARLRRRWDAVRALRHAN